MLSVLHINTCDINGGSAKASHRLHRGLQRLGVRSRMLVGWKLTAGDPDIGILAGRGLRLANRLCGEVVDQLDLKYLFYPASFYLPLRRWFREADVLQLGNLHGSYFSFTALPWLTARKPIVWRLDDMWPLTGHCGWSYDCQRWQTGCGQCPQLHAFPYLRRDTTNLLWRIKRWAYAHSTLTLVSPSKWLADLARRSPLLGRFPVHVIPYGVDTDVFRPVDQAAARRALNLPPDETALLFMANVVSERRKGGHLLPEVFAKLAQRIKTRIRLLVIGAGADACGPFDGIAMSRLGFVHDEQQLALAYSAADLTVFPSVADNLPNVLIESASCGTPSVAFGVGGVPDVVRHVQTGYLAASGDVEAFTNGMSVILSRPELAAAMRQECRAVAVREYSLETQARRYLAVYRQVLGEDHAPIVPIPTESALAGVAEH